MTRAIELAEKGRYSVSPNPMVGCVIVKGDAVVGEGHHERAGEPHAEIHALRAAGDAARGATAYVSLEPCSHHGRTPPCADSLVEAGITRVVAAVRDPSPQISGRGLQRLRDAGIEASEGVLSNEASRLNETFLFSAANQRPFVIVKAGMSLDGKLATVTGSSRWITGEDSRNASLALREEVDAILVGSGTIAADDPNLTRRLGWNRSINPFLRVIIDANGGIPLDARVLNDGNATLVVTSHPDIYPANPELEIAAVESEGDIIEIERVFGLLHARGVRSVLVEGGSRVLTNLLRGNAWQKMVLFIAPMVIGGGSAPSILARGYEELTEAPRFRFDRIERIGDDVEIVAYPRED